MTRPNAACRWVLGAVLAAGAVLAQAQPVGRVLLAAGDAFAVRDGKPVRLAFNSPVEAKDVLRTGAASSLQVRFADEGLISLRENSEFAIEEYRFAGKEDGSERGFFRLLRGGFRAVTGLIGRTQNANYKVRAETATIGIRGTDYAVRDCRGDCGPGAKDGLYGTVLGMSSGTNQVTVTNNTGEHAFGINQHFHVPDANSRPQPLLQPPSFVAVRPQGKAQAAQQGGSGTGDEQAGGSSGAAAESRPQTVAEPVAAPTATYVSPYTITNTSTSGGQSAIFPVGDIGFLGALVKDVGSQGQGSGGGLGFSSQLTTATEGGFTVLTAFSNFVTGDLSDDQSIISGTKGSLTVLNPGCVNLPGTGCLTVPTDPDLKMVWGRWQDGTFTDDEGTTTFNTSSGGLHYLGGFGVTPYSVIASRSGVATFMPVGGTTPTNNYGQTASASLIGNMVVTFGANPGAVLQSLNMSWSPSAQLPSGQSYNFSNVAVPIKSANGGKVAALDFLGTVNGTCSGSCASPNTLLDIQGGFAGQTGNHAGMVITTTNGPVFTGQVKVFSCNTGC